MFGYKEYCCLTFIFIYIKIILSGIISQVSFLKVLFHWDVKLQVSTFTWR